MIKAKTALPNIAFFDLGRLAGRELRIGRSRPGLRMRLFGPGGTRKLQDILVDAKIPRDERGQWPVIYSGDDPIWVPGIRRSDAAPVNGKTKKVLRMEMERDGR
jgi:tRNA(Ile)-lysidine synthase